MAFRTYQNEKYQVGTKVLSDLWGEDFEQNLWKYFLYIVQYMLLWLIYFYNNVIHNLVQNLTLISAQLKKHIRYVPPYEFHKGVKGAVEKSTERVL